MDKIICSKCEEKKPVTAFSFKNKTKGIRNSTCKLCHKEYVKKHYKQNKESYVARARKNNPEYATRNKQLAAEYLASRQCQVCGESDIVVLDFDHRDEKEKEYTIASMIRTGYAWETILQEIAKCDILCSNCHRRRTAKQFGTFRAMFGK